MAMQIPDAALARELGVEAWALMVFVISGVGTVAFFLRRMVQMMDRMAVAQEAAPGVFAELKTLLVERLERIEEKLDLAVQHSAEHVRIAKLWEKTEAPGRSVRREGEA